MTDTITAATAATPVPEPLPPYSGEDALCAMCSHDLAYTYFRAERARVQREFNGRMEWHHAFPARLERQCKRCDYQWDEALNPPPGPEPARPATVAEVSEALQNAHQGWALDLSPGCADHMAGILLDLLLIDVRTDHPAWTKPARSRPLLAPPAAPADPDPALTSPVPMAIMDQQDQPQPPTRPTFGAPIPLHDKTEDDA
ncbi:hypothetical protein [Streptomyces cyaneofuscatus]|uniref:hypothetical protein n=1 Tax=Streptomyces cyaneofuscatus TaxID=66883 RepID=UPI0036DC74D7